MLIASTNPLIVYYFDGFLRIAFQTYDLLSEDRAVHIANTDLTKEIVNELIANGTITQEEGDVMLANQMKNFGQLQAHLMERDKIQDKNWINNYLKPQMQKAMVHIMRMSKEHIGTANNHYQICGVDFILDEDLKLWFIEANIKPALMGTTPEKTTFMTKMLKDHFEIIYGLLRSRMKRVVKFVNKLTNEYTPEQIFVGVDHLQNYPKIQSSFDDINRNYFEPEYTPSAGNKFVKILDENVEGPAKFNNLFPKECFN